MWGLLVKPVSDIINNIIDKIAPDAQLASELKAAFISELLRVDADGFKAQASILLAEVNGESWLQRNWRPMLMVWFSVLIGGYWFGYTPENLSEATVLKLFSLVQIGMGGYIIGRSGEKMIKEWKR